MAEETTTHKHTHKEQRRQYTFNKLKAFGQEIIGDVEKEKVPTLRILETLFTTQINVITFLETDSVKGLLEM